MSIIQLIVAHAHRRVIGLNNSMPWHLPEDLRHFKALTTGHCIIMGRKTYASIGKPLPNRLNIVITRQIGWQAEGVIVAHSLEQAITQALAHFPALPVFVIGGAQIYKQALPLADRLYITEIDANLDGDTVFPAYNKAEWQEISREKHDNGALRFDFVCYQRIKM